MRVAAVAGFRPFAGRGVIFCVEPLGSNETNFITNVDEAAELVRQVDHGKPPSQGLGGPLLARPRLAVDQMPDGIGSNLLEHHRGAVRPQHTHRGDTRLAQTEVQRGVVAGTQTRAALAPDRNSEPGLPPLHLL